MKNYRLTLKLHGPVHIGSGNTIGKNEFVIDQKSRILYIMDMEKMFSALCNLRFDSDYEKYVLSGGRGLAAFFREHSIFAAEYKKWAVYSFPMPEIDDIRSFQIQQTIKDAYNLPFIPGSSLKGAIRNCIMCGDLLKKEDSLAHEVYNEKRDFKNRTGYLRDQSNRLNIRYHTLGRNEKKVNDAVNSVFQDLVIGDSSPLSLDDLTICQKIDLAPDNTENRLNIYRECLRPGTIISFEIGIGSNFPYGIDDIISAIDSTYKRNNEVFLSKFPKEPTPSGHLMYLGGGTGFVSKTVIYSLIHDNKKALETASVILDKVDSMNRGKKVGDHLNDPREYNVSPHMRKQTSYNGNYYDFGLCSVDIKEL